MVSTGPDYRRMEEAQIWRRVARRMGLPAVRGSNETIRAKIAEACRPGGPYTPRQLLGFYEEERMVTMKKSRATMRQFLMWARSQAKRGRKHKVQPKCPPWADVAEAADVSLWAIDRRLSEIRF